MTACSAPGCAAVAVRQWQRHGSDVEAAAHARSAHARRVQRSEDTAGQIELALLELRNLRQRAAEANAKPRALAQVDTQIRQAENLLHTAEGQLAKTKTTEPAADTVRIAVFACKAHNVNDDTATLTHQADCVPGSCKCKTEG